MSPAEVQMAPSTGQKSAASPGAEAMLGPGNPRAGQRETSGPCRKVCKGTGLQNVPPVRTQGCLGQQRAGREQTPQVHILLAADHTALGACFLLWKWERTSPCLVRTGTSGCGDLGGLGCMGC